MSELKINVADMTKIPPLIAQMLLKQRDIIELGTSCRGNKIDSCHYIIQGPDEKLKSIQEIFKDKGIRSQFRE